MASRSKIQKGKEEERTFILTDRFEVLLASSLNSIPFQLFCRNNGYTGKKNRLQHSTFLLIGNEGKTDDTSIGQTVFYLTSEVSEINILSKIVIKDRPVKSTFFSFVF